jgi:hypothetical protein
MFSGKDIPRAIQERERLVRAHAISRIFTRHVNTVLPRGLLGLHTLDALGK